MLGCYAISLHGKIPLKKRFLFFKRAIAAHLSSPDAINSLCTPSQIIEQQQLFGYDLGIEYQYGCTHHYRKTPGRAILYLHPWGLIGIPHKRSAELLRSYNVLPGDVIIFNFPDGGWRFPVPFVHTSFGQLSDVLPAIYTLAYAYDHFDLHAIDLFGYSRGGAVAINMIAVLNDETDMYDKQLASIGIDRQKRKKLLTLIQAGSLVLDCPLIDVNATFNQYSNLIQSFFFRFTHYIPEGLQALESIEKISDLSLKVLIHFQCNDQRVFNNNDATVYCMFKKHNPETTFLVLGDDGGHTHTHEALAKSIHQFYKRVGGAYNSFVTESNSSQQKSEESFPLLQPSLKEAHDVIKTYYNQHTQK